MTLRIPAALRSSFFLAVAALAVACSSAPSEEESVRHAEERAIRAPQTPRIGEAVGTGKTPLDTASAFDDRRDPWQDENPSLGENPDRWIDANGNVDNVRTTRQFGYQWLRSYARNSTFAFFETDDFIEVGDGTRKLKPLRESTASAHIAELTLDAKGFELCPEKPLAAQMRNGASGPAECTGTLIDKNLMLTAAHCVRELSDFTLKHGDMANVRVALNYALTSPEQIVSAGSGVNDPRELHFVPGRDIFRVREVLSMNINFVDFAILELLDEAGNPIAGVDPMYQPVPLWESATTGLPYQTFRPGAAIGVGSRLPQKISLSRSTGWLSDPQFLGISIDADIFGGNSGGGIYDVETGSLVGLVNAEFEHILNIHCPAIPAKVNPWPFCPATPVSGSGKQVQLALTRVPDFSVPPGGGAPTPRGCSGWIPQSWPNTEQNAFMAFITSNFTFDSADLDLSGAPQKSAVGASLQAVRMLACGPANSSQPLDVAIAAAANNVVTLGQQAAAAAGAPVGVCKGTGINEFCPSAVAVGHLPINPDQGKLFEIDPSLSLATAAATLRNSRLCAGTAPLRQAALWSDLPQISLESGRETTVHGTTVGGTDFFSTSTDHQTSTPDALYRIQVPTWTVLYADTFSGGRDLATRNPGTTFDTSLFLMEVADSTQVDPLLVTSSWEPVGGAFDDSNCSPIPRPNQQSPIADFDLQSQLVQVLEPNKPYVLAVTGFAGATGKFNLHTQSIPAPRNGQVVRPQDAVQTFTTGGAVFDLYQSKPLDATASEQGCSGLDPNGNFDPACMYSVQPQIACQSTDTGEFGFIAVSCPLSHTNQFNFRVTATSTPFGLYNDDPVAQYWDGQVRHTADGYVCGDDSQTLLGVPPFFTFLFPSLTSEIGTPGEARPESEQTFMPSGAGVHGFYAHQFQSFLNWQNIGYSLKIPDDSAHDIWSNQ